MNKLEFQERFWDIAIDYVHSDPLYDGVEHLERKVEALYRDLRSSVISEVLNNSQKES